MKEKKQSKGKIRVTLLGALLLSLLFSHTPLHATAPAATIPEPLTVQLYAATLPLNPNLHQSAVFSKRFIEKISDEHNFVPEYKTFNYTGKEFPQVLTMTFYNENIKENYSIIPQSVGKIPVSVYAPQRRVDLAHSIPRRWPKIKIAYLKGPMNCTNHFLKFSAENIITEEHSFIECNNYDEMLNLVENNFADAFLLASVNPITNFEKIASIGLKPYYMAVRNDCPEIFEKFNKSIHRIRAEEHDAITKYAVGILKLPPIKNRVRVGVFHMPGICERTPDGSYIGSCIDYLNKIAKINSWDLDYVNCTSQNAIEYLKKGYINILGNVSYNTKLSNEVLFPHYPSTKYSVTLYVRPDSNLKPNHLEDAPLVEIMAMRGNSQTEELIDKLISRKVNFKIHYFDSMDEAEKAFLKGMGDAIITSTSLNLSQMRDIYTTTPEQTFFACSLTSTNIYHQLENAIKQLSHEEPTLIDDLYKKYTPATDSYELYFTHEEITFLKDFVKQEGTLTVDVTPSFKALKEYDTHTHTLTGFAGHILKYVTEKTGIKFKILPPTTPAEAIQRLDAGKVDLWFDYFAKISEIPNDHLVLDYIKLPQVIVTRKDKVDTTKIPAFAVHKDDVKRIDELKLLGCNDPLIVNYPEEGFTAVAKGRVAALIIDAANAHNFISKLDLKNRLDIRSYEATHITPSFTIRMPTTTTTTTTLNSILSKTIKSITPEQTKSMLFNALAELNDRDRISWHQLIAFISGLAIIAGLFFSAHLLHSRHKIESAFSLLEQEHNQLTKLSEIRERLMKELDEKQHRLVLAVEEARQMAKAKTVFLSTMSHEIRTPLNAVIGYADFLSKPNVTKSEIEEYTSGISKSASALLSLINDILDLSKLEAGAVNMRSGVSDISKLFREMESIFAYQIRSKELFLKSIIKPDFPLLHLLEQRLRQMLLNIIGNSIKFTEKGGITIEADYQRDGEHTVSVTLKVTDTGIGVSKEFIKEIFNPFKQDIHTQSHTNGIGTGLGLPIVKRLVEACGGTIDLQSEIHKGTVTTISIPHVSTVEGSVAMGKKETSAVDFTIPPNIKVLIVDDVLVNIKVFAIHLKSLGIHNSLMATSGEAALEILRKEKVDMIFTDVWMPGISGIDLANKLHQDPELASIPIFAVTADADAKESFDTNQFTDILTKPVTTNSIATALKHLYA